jgi:hypothetical protein
MREIIINFFFFFFLISGNFYKAWSFRLTPADKPQSVYTHNNQFLFYFNIPHVY